MQDNDVLKLLYKLFLGVLLAIFVGVAVSTFYEAPKSPDYNTYGSVVKVEDPEANPDLEKNIIAQQLADEQYQNERRTYEQNVAVIILVSAVVMLAVSILLEKRYRFFSDSFVIGSLITLVHSIIRSGNSENSQLMFAATTVSLIAVVYLGYHRFIEKPAKKVTKKAAPKKAKKAVAKK